MRVIAKLHDALNMLKDFDAGYTTRNKKQMIVKFEGVNYKVTLEEIGEGDIAEHLKRL